MLDNIRWTIEDLGFTNILVVVLMGIVEVSFVMAVFIILAIEFGVRQFV